MEGNFFSIFIGFFVSAVVWIGVLLLAIAFIVQRRALIRTRRELEQAKTATPTASSTSTLADRLSAPPPAPVRPAPTPNTIPSGTVNIKLIDGVTAPADPVLSVLRDQADGRLLVYIEGVGYRTLIDQSDARKRFTALMKELAQTVAETAPPRPSSTPAPAPTVDEIPLPPLDAFDLPDVDSLVALPDEDAPAAPRRPAAPIKDATQAPGTFDLPDYRTLAKNDGVTPGGGFLRRGKLELSQLPELNIAGAIEAYLQHKLTQTDAFTGREIHVHPATDGGVVIEVDGMYFENVNDVTDAAARKFISTAIQEWQERQK